MTRRARLGAMPTRTLKPVDGGARLLLRDHANGIPEALALAAELLELCPENAYPWRIEIQKPTSGSRGTTVCVTFQVAGRAPARRQDPNDRRES